MGIWRVTIRLVVDICAILTSRNRSTTVLFGCFRLSASPPLPHPLTTPLPPLTIPPTSPPHTLTALHQSCSAPFLLTLLLFHSARQRYFFNNFFYRDTNSYGSICNENDEIMRRPSKSSYLPSCVPQQSTVINLDFSSVV